jgi:pimeloyl-ACP methyl ester carboxylesterase
LRNGRTYFRPYHAAFGYDMEGKLPQVQVPTLITAARDDNVFAHLDRSHALLPGSKKAATAGILSKTAAAETAAVFAEFLDR